jgi:hypothetical protein
MQEKNKVTVNLKGGLGNQLFQILAGYNYAKVHNKEFFIDYENKFHASQGNHPSAYKNNLFENILENKIDSSFNLYNEPSFEYNKIPFIDGNVLLEGYFQSNHYFDNDDLDIISFSSLKLKMDKIDNFIDDNTVGIHVRGGDYKIYPKHNIINQQYYIDSTSLFKNSKFYAVTDDNNYANQLLPENVKIIDGGSEIGDFLFLTRCKNLIISNSTLSLFASYFNKKDTIVAPSRWFNDNTNTEGLYRNEFKIITV